MSNVGSASAQFDGRVAIVSSAWARRHPQGLPMSRANISVRFGRCRETAVGPPSPET